MNQLNNFSLPLAASFSNVSSSKKISLLRSLLQVFSSVTHSWEGLSRDLENELFDTEDTSFFEGVDSSLIYFSKFTAKRGPLPKKI